MAAESAAKLENALKTPVYQQNQEQLATTGEAIAYLRESLDALAIEVMETALQSGLNRSQTAKILHTHHSTIPQWEKMLEESKETIAEQLELIEQQMRNEEDL